MIKFLNLVFDAFQDSQRKRAQRRLLSQLDERTLRDIGLEFEANTMRERSRRIDVRFSAY